MSTRVRPPAKPWRLRVVRARPPHGPPTWLVIVLADLADAVFITMYSCSFVHHVDRPWLRTASSGPSVQAYSHSSFTVLVPRHEPFASPSLLTSILHHGPSAWIFRLTFTTHRRLPCRILHLHITSQEIHQIHTMLSNTHHPKMTTIGPQLYLITFLYISRNPFYLFITAWYLHATY